MRLERVVDPRDERLAPFRDLRDRALARDGGTFIAESEVVVRKLLASRLRVRALLLTAPRLASLAALLDESYVVYLAEQAVMDAVVGFHVHRGCLAWAERPRAGVPEAARTVLVLEDLADVDNVGSLVRNAVAFGAEGVFLSPRCADPFYRKAIRTSAGHVFHVAVERLAEWPAGLAALRRRYTLVGAVLDRAAVPLACYEWPERVGLVLGTEGAGVSSAARGLCDALVTIPMAPAADSLNVAVAGAVALYARAARAPPT